jgi:Fe2+ or Zn2+ uptake regulation protein
VVEKTIIHPISHSHTKTVMNEYSDAVSNFGQPPRINNINVITTSHNPPEINPKTNKNEFIKLFAEESLRAIISITSKEEYSALQISRELNIPLTTVYRKMKILENASLIQHVKTVIDFSGNEEKYYRCMIREATVKFCDGEFSIHIEKLDYKDKLIRLWKRLAKPEG